MDVGKVERIAGKSDSSAGSALNEEGVLVSYIHRNQSQFSHLFCAQMFVLDPAFASSSPQVLNGSWHSLLLLPLLPLRPRPPPRQV